MNLNDEIVICKYEINTYWWPGTFLPHGWEWNSWLNWPKDESDVHLHGQIPSTIN